MTAYVSVDLEPHLNATAASTDARRSGPTLNAWGNTFPAEELPFGATVLVSGVPFRLPASNGAHADHVEARGQEIVLRRPTAARGLALLCCGEMGDQALWLEVRTVDGAGALTRRRVFVAAKGWLTVPKGELADGRAFTHLHYVGDYELDLLCPVIWCARHDWPATYPVARIALGTNPLFHIFALTLLVEAERDG